MVKQTEGSKHQEGVLDVVMFAKMFLYFVVPQSLILTA